MREVDLKQYIFCLTTLPVCGFLRAWWILHKLEKSGSRQSKCAFTDVVLYQLLCFLTNLKSRVALDIDDCPLLDGFVHDPKKYPLYYLLFWIISQMFYISYKLCCMAWVPFKKLHAVCASCRKFDLKGELSVERNATLFGFRVIYERMVYIHCHIL